MLPSRPRLHRIQTPPRGSKTCRDNHKLSINYWFVTAAHPSTPKVKSVYSAHLVVRIYLLITAWWLRFAPRESPIKDMQHKKHHRRIVLCNHHLQLVHNFSTVGIIIRSLPILVNHVQYVISRRKTVLHEEVLAEKKLTPHGMFTTVPSLTIHSTMLTAIQEYIKEQTLTPTELTEMMFIDTQFETISADEMKALAQYENLEFLNFAECGLKSVEAPFPFLRNCGAVLFSSNALNNDVIETLVNLENLESLALDGNQITSLDKFSLLGKLAKLREVCLIDCPVAQTEDYRAKLFALLPQVQIIDDVDREGNVVELEDSEEDFSDDESGSFDEEEIDLENLYGTEDDDEEEDDEEDDDEDEDEEDEDDEEDDDEEPAVKKTRNE